MDHRLLDPGDQIDSDLSERRCDATSASPGKMHGERDRRRLCGNESAGAVPRCREQLIWQTVTQRSEAGSIPWKL